ncbi:MAG: T9SS type A sorting domain-containing protein [Bacteroidales bacterium]|nr:T9SS type A sorting domain-containing protein [Bacteroidales bacterium]
MKKILFFLATCCIAMGAMAQQETQQIFLRIDKDIPYEPTSIDKTLKQILSIDPQITFNVYREGKEDNNVHLRFHQFLNDYRIEGSDLLVHVRNNKIAIINGSYYTSVKSAIKSSSLSESEILKIAEKEVFASKTDYDFQYEIEKVISKNYLDNNDKNLYYASKVFVSDGNDLGNRIEVIIDEGTGKVLRKNSLTICEFCYLSILSFQESNSYISPNPVKDYLTLTLPTDNNEIKIFDLQGKLLLQQNVEFSAELNVSMLPKGTYVLVVNNSESLTFIKQ